MKTLTNFFVCVAVLFAWPLPFFGAQGAKKASARQEYLVYIGTYTGPAADAPKGSTVRGKGIYAYRYQTSTGKLTALGAMTDEAECANPAYLAATPNGRFLYSVCWGGHETKVNDSVAAFAIDPKTGKLTFLNKVTSRGTMATQLSVDHSGRDVLVANYGSGSAVVLPIGQDGRLGEATAFALEQGHSVTKRQEGPVVHGVITSPDNRFAIVAEFGLDKVFAYPFNAAKGTLTQEGAPFVTVSPGSAPRHLAFHPNGKILYVNNEIGSSVSVFSYEAASGNMKELQTISTLPPGFTGRSSTAEIQTDAAGKFLYVSNRGHDSIAVFAIDSAKGTLTPVEHVPSQGKYPRYFTLDPTGKYMWVFNENSANLVVFRVDQNTGRLTPTGEVIDVPNPGCAIFVKAL